MGMFDYFVAALECPGCGKTSAADASTDMQTKIRRQPSLANLSVGDPLSFTLDEAIGAGYLSLKPWQPGEPIHLVDSWSCPQCHKERWAEIVIEGLVIRSIESVTLNDTLIARTHLISDRYT